MSENNSNDDEVTQEQHQTRKSPSYIQLYERGMYEFRLNHPILHHVTIGNMLFASLYTAARLRRRGNIFSAMATLVTLTCSSMACFAYARSYSTKFQTDLALPVRETIVGEDVAQIENMKLIKLREKKRLLQLLQERETHYEEQLRQQEQQQQQQNTTEQQEVKSEK
jgi:hypothetical protein